MNSNQSKIVYSSKCLPKCNCNPCPDQDNNNNSTCCDCVDQMANIIQQIITLYPNNNLFITLSSGDAVIGTPNSIISSPNGNPGVFEVINNQGNIQQLLSICDIDTIRIENAIYNNSISYLPSPNPIPTGCCTDCEETIRSLLPIGTANASIITNTQIPSQGTVIKNEYGMVVLADTNQNNVTFVSSCKIDLIYKENPITFQ